MNPFKTLLGLVAAAILLVMPTTTAHADGAAASSESGGASKCDGQYVLPWDLDWDNVFPITIAGVQINATSNSNPPIIYAPPVCVCPGIFGMPSPGIGVTYWQPAYIAEAEWRPGCMPTLGGMNALSGKYQIMAGEKQEEDNSGARQAKGNRTQIHWYTYPLMSLLQTFQSMACKKSGSYSLAYMTEFDYTWQNDLWSAVFAPEASAFGSPILQASCSLEAASAAAGIPLEPLFWCQGNWGDLYPFSGNTSHQNSDYQANHSAIGKFIARQFRVGLLWVTVGPSALCYAHPSPIVMKSQYRFNQVYPIRRYGRAVTFGDPGLFQMPPVANYATHESTADVIWEATECCARTY